jgi:serine/threonine protein kinase
MTDQFARLTASLADRYRIERELGAGGMATVYLAEDLKHNRKVAVKVLKPELAVAIGADRFLAEIKTTANLQHSHILALHDSGEVNGTVFYVKNSCRSRMRSASRARSPTRFSMRTNAVLSTVTSSPRTFSFSVATLSSLISASHSPRRKPAARA